MWELLVSLTLCGACCYVSGRRLLIASRPSQLDYAELFRLFRNGPATPSLRETRLENLKARVRGIDAELLDALLAPPAIRPALVNEALAEFEARLRTWERVPRSAASIASTCGFLLGAITLRANIPSLSDLPEEVWQAAFSAGLFRTLNVVAMGLAAAMFCAASHLHSTKEARERGEELDRFVDLVEPEASAVE